MIVPRRAWNARPPLAPPSRLTLPTEEVWLHHSASTAQGSAAVHQIQGIHQAPPRRWSDIAYSFVVDAQGVIYEGRGAGVIGAHTEGRNSRSHGICILGNYENERPTEASLDAVAKLLRHGAEAGWWRRPALNGGHRDTGKPTACPGRFLHERITDINERAAAHRGGPFMGLSDKEQRELYDWLARVHHEIALDPAKSSVGLREFIRAEIRREMEAAVAELKGKAAS